MQNAVSINENPVGAAGTLRRGLAILELLARQEEMSAAELGSALSLSRATVYRILNSLTEARFVERAAGGFSLGAKAAEIGMAAVARLDVVAAARAELRDLVAATLETVFLAVVMNDEVVYIHREMGPQPVTMSSRLGSRRPLHSTALGKAYLAALPVAEQRTVVARLEMPPLTANTITEPAALLAELERTAGRGYAVDDVEGEVGVACCAAAVRNHFGEPVAAISVAGPAERILPHVARFGPAVAEAAGAVSRRLGHVLPAAAEGRREVG